MKNSHPMQPIVFDEHNVARFKENKICSFLIDVGSIDLNDIARQNFSDEDRTQFAQLIGHSVSGAGDLPYFDREVLAKADAEVESISKIPEILERLKKWSEKEDD